MNKTKTNHKRGFLILAILFFALSIQAQERMDEMWGDQPVIFRQDIGNRAAVFDDGNYAMFIHWGLYSNIANKWKGKTYYGISEWIMNPRRANIPPAEYKEQAQYFNPVNFDAMAIAQLAKDAGMKYIIVTSKHHDGFAMYNSKSNDFNIVDATPFKKDPMKELAKACKTLGLGFGFYYSHFQDWTFPGGGKGPVLNEKGEEVDFDYYFEKKCLPQVKEITTEYGDIAIVWFDTPGTIDKKYVKELVQVVKENQPNALICGRAGYGLGDYLSYGDMQIPMMNIPGLWETVDVTNDSWGYAWYDENWKSPKRLLKSVISTVGRGGTYMLNVGPKPDGTIPVEAQYALRKSGEWIKKHPQVIYNADPSPWGRAQAWGDITVTNGKLNVLVYDWPLDGELYLFGLENDIKSACLLVGDKKETIKTQKKGQWTIFNLPARRPDNLISVIEVELKGTPKVSTVLGIDPVNETTLSVYFGTAEGTEVSGKKWMEKFGEWKHIEQVTNWKDGAKIVWEVEVFEPGYYQIDLNYSGDRGQNKVNPKKSGSWRLVWRITNDEGDSVQNQQNASHVYKFYKMGLMHFKKAGKHTISVQLIEGNPTTTSLQDIRFTPLQSLE